MSDKVNLLDFSPADLTAFVVDELGEKPFRAGQLLKWIYQYGVTDFARMSNIKKELRGRLSEAAEIRAPGILEERRSRDGTVKWALDIGGGQAVETVLIPEEGRNTLCVSTQAGCPVRCSFCRTGAAGFSRNLRVSEIIGQVFQAASRVGFSENREHKPISNVVMMGMGEPLLNLTAVLKTTELLLSDYAFALSKRRVTISTAGVAPVINRIAGSVDVALALSLHAPDDRLRDELVPLNRRYPLRDTLAAVRNYLDRSNANCGRVTIEYVLLDHVNDSEEQARELCRLLARTPCKINLIPFNPHPDSPYARPGGGRVERFQRILMDKGFTVLKRSTRGDDIAAACGQLAGRIRDAGGNAGRQYEER